MYTLGKNMRAERARLGLTIKNVAEKLGVHPNAVSRWESDETDPAANNLIALCNLYGCSPEYLLDMTDERNGKMVATDT